jgi:hypothetical protein
MTSNGDDDEPAIGGGLTGVGRFFTDPCGCGSGRSYGTCCAIPEAEEFLSFCEALALDREMTIEIGQLAWRIARDTPALRWRRRIEDVAIEMFHDEPENQAKLVALLATILDAHRLMFPGIDGSAASKA